MSLASVWRRLRVWVVDANDGIIATAGLLQGFAGAGADNLLLITAATAATIAGALGVGGAKWAESAAEREAQLAIARQELARLTENPEEEKAELVAYYVKKGLTPELAHEVAEQLNAADPVAAQLRIEYGIDEIPGPSVPVTEGLGTAGAFALGASIPLIITTLAPFTLDTLALLLAVTVSLTLTSILTARSAHLSAPRTIVRTLAVGLGTMAVSYLAGLALLPPAD